MSGWQKKNGCVYFFKHTGLEPIKVGYSTSNDPYKRFEQFKTYAPFGAEIVFFERSSMALGCERIIHEKFSEKRLKGEWFILTQEDLDYCRDLIKGIEKLHV